MDKYGAPSKGDATAQLDAIVERAARKFNDTVTKMSVVLNRPIGSVPAGTDYGQIKGDPQAHATLLQTMMAQSGPMKGLISYIQYVQKQEGRHGSAR